MTLEQISQEITEKTKVIADALSKGSYVEIHISKTSGLVIAEVKKEVVYR